MFDEKYLATIEQRVAKDTQEARDRGQKVVGVYCAFTPKELIAAAGAIPVALCGGTHYPIAAAERHLPRNLCALIKSSYGHALEQTCPYFQAADLLLADATCDGKKKMFELLSRLRPLHLLQLPQINTTAESKAYWLTEIYRIKEVLEQHLGVEITHKALREQIDLYNRLRRAINTVYSLNCGEIPLLYGSELDRITAMGGFEHDLEIRIAEIAEATAQAKKRGEKKEFVDEVCGKPRILLTGCPTTNKKILQLIECSGGMVVAMENCGGLKTIGDLVDVDEPPMEALAERYLLTACSCMAPNPRRIEILEDLIDSYRIDGIVDLTWEGCHTYNIESFMVEEALAEKEKPFLHITTDYSENDTGQIKTRIEAFLEILT